ncbi:MAG: tetratricopeptide repeat protein, partial [Blastocatellia bacterium]
RLKSLPAAGRAAARARVLLARAELGQGNIQTAYAELQRALEADPQSIDALFYLATVSEALAPQVYERLYSLAPNSERVHQLLAEAALAQENQAEAEAEFKAALQANPRSIDALLGLADLKRAQSSFDEALSLYRQAVSIIGLNHDLAYGMGVCHMYRQEYEPAIESFRKAIGYSPDAAESHFALGNALFQSGRLAEAIEPLNRAVALNPKIKQSWFLLGRAYQRSGQAELAKAAFKRVDELTKEELEKEQSTEKRAGQKSPRRP